MPHYTFELNTADGLKLQGQGWEPETGSRAVVCLVHGIGEHSNRYEHLAEALNRAGYTLLAFDLRGHGRSEGPRGHAPNYECLMSDISQLLEKAQERYPELPVLLYGHSLGGNLVIHYALRCKPALAGVIASSPLLRLAYKAPVWKTGILNLMYALRIKCSIPRGVDDMALSHDLNVARTKRTDPLWHGLITPQLAVDMLRKGKWNLAHASEFPCPLLLMHGDADRITSAQASSEFADSAGDQCTLKIWKGLYHELHNECEKMRVLEYTTEWLNALGN
jgi:acylglycerol lipase